MSTPPDPTPSARIIAFPEAAIRRRHAPEGRYSLAGAIVMALLAAALVIGLGVLGSAWWAARHTAERVGRADHRMPAYVNVHPQLVMAERVP